MSYSPWRGPHIEVNTMYENPEHPVVRFKRALRSLIPWRLFEKRREHGWQKRIFYPSRLWRSRL
jgi:hypothetical protein